MDEKHLSELIRKFAYEREWDQFHSPKNLAISLSLEASELLELFQLSRGTGGWEDFQDASFRKRVEEELADILLYLVRFADLAGIQLEAAALNKLAKNAQKYPVDLAKGSDKKYNEFVSKHLK